MQNMETLVAILAFFMFVACILQLLSLKRIDKLEKRLDEEYWTKDVIGKTINSKTGRDPCEAEEVYASDAKEFCEILKENIGKDPMPCCNPFVKKVGFSYVDNQKFYVTLSLAVFREGQDDIPVKCDSLMEVNQLMERLIKHYKELECKCGPNDGCDFCGGNKK